MFYLMNFIDVEYGEYLLIMDNFKHSKEDDEDVLKGKIHIILKQTTVKSNYKKYRVGRIDKFIKRCVIDNDADINVLRERAMLELL